MYYFAAMVEMHWGRWPGNPSPLDWAVFVALSSTSAFFVLYLGYLGARLLIKEDAAALRLVCVVFVLEIGYFWADTLVTWNLGMIFRPHISVGLWGIAMDPLAPQVITGYPVIGLIVAISLIFLKRRFASPSHTASGKSKVRSVVLFSRWIVAGAFIGLLTSVLIGWLIMPRHPNAGDGILAMLLPLILVPIGSFVGCVRAVMIFERDKPQT